MEPDRVQDFLRLFFALFCRIFFACLAIRLQIFASSLAAQSRHLLKSLSFEHSSSNQIDRRFKVHKTAAKWNTCLARNFSGMQTASMILIDPATDAMIRVIIEDA